jgi:hypothetical protein
MKFGSHLLLKYSPINRPIQGMAARVPRKTTCCLGLPSSVVWCINKRWLFNLHIYSSAANEWYICLSLEDSRDLSTEATSMPLRHCTCELADGRRWRIHDEHDKTIKHHFVAFVVWTVCDEQVYHQWQGVSWIRYVSWNERAKSEFWIFFQGIFACAQPFFPACAAYDVMNSNMAATTPDIIFECVWLRLIANKLITPIWSAQNGHNHGWTVLYVRWGYGNAM